MVNTSKKLKLENELYSFVGAKPVEAECEWRKWVSRKEYKSLDGVKGATYGLGAVKDQTGTIRDGAVIETLEEIQLWFKDK